MSVKRAFALQDTYIDERSLTANLGLSPILQVHNIFSTVKDRKEFARIFIKFNLSALTGSINAGDLPDPTTDSTVSAYLYMFDAKHEDEIATSFNIDVHPLTQEWDEGRGLDIEDLAETGYANALSAQSTVAWTTTGGKFKIDASSATQHFNHGEENLRVKITDLFVDWLGGNTGNFGVAIKMSDAQEIKTGTNSALSHNFKKFHGRETNTTMAPYIQLEWDDSIKDDRAEISFNSTGNLYFYNIVNGQLQDLNTTGPFPGNITISGDSTSIKTGLVAARKSKGIYKCDIGTLPLTSNTYSTFKDNWFVSASPTANYAFTFTTSNPASGFDNFKTSEYRISMQNIKREYEKGSKGRVRIHIKDDSTTFTALTAATTAVTNFIVTDGTIEIRESTTDEVEVSAYNISRDVNGNFFEIDTDNLFIGVKYNPVLKLNVRGETIYVSDPDTYEFKVI